MARLGELLVAARLLDQDQIERALQAQVLWGGRLGTNLIELGMLDLDGISRALGRQHGLPAALARHFDRADRELQDRLPEELARRWSVVPLLHVGADKSKIAIAALDPLAADALVELADAFLCEPSALVVSIAAEMRVRYHLERIYGVARPSRYLRSRGTSVTPFPQFDNVPVPIDSDAEVAVPIAVDESAHPTGVAEVPAIEDPAAPAADDAALTPAERRSADATRAAADDDARAPADDLASAPDDDDAALAPAARHSADATRAAADDAVLAPAARVSAEATRAAAPDAEAAPARRTRAEFAAEARAAAALAVIGEPVSSVMRPAPVTQTPDEADDLAALIDDAIARVTATEPTVPVGRDRRTYVRTLADDLPGAEHAPPAPRTRLGQPTSLGLGQLGQSAEPAQRAGHADDAEHAVPTDRGEAASAGQHSLTPAPASVVSARPSGVSLGRMEIKRVGPDVAKPAQRTGTQKIVPGSLLEAVRAIRRSPDRDRVAELVVDALARFVAECDAAVLLVVRGDVALSWKQFSRGCEAPEDIAVPLDQPGLVPTVIQRNTVARAAATELGPIDEALMRSLTQDLHGDLVVVPIAIVDRVLCLIAAATPSDAPVEAVEAVAGAAATAFARLIRDASR